jgi:hypothetical protein
MQESAVSPLPAWESFYVILGSSAAVLTGLVFVAITLTADTQTRRSRAAMWAGIEAFNTSTIVHLCTVLLVSALLSAPWHELSNAGLLLGLAGLGGIAYALLTLRRLRRQDGYSPEPEDVLSYAIVPLVAYAALVGAAILLPEYPRRALFGIGAVVLLLLFLGLRNAWDLVTYVAVLRAQGQAERQD